MCSKLVVFDIEADSLNPTKIHCMSASVLTNGKSYSVKSTTDYDVMRKFFTSTENTLIGHNIIKWDVPQIERLLDIKVTARLIDTLPLSWYLYNSRPTHGLEKWGEDLGVEKPKIDDWENQSVEDYIFRCESDVKINTLLYKKQLHLLNKLYNDDQAAVDKVINYLSMVMKVHRNIEEHPFKLDTPKCKAGVEELESLKEFKTSELKAVMPRDEVTSKKSKPNKCYKVDGTLSTLGEKWFTFLKDNDLPSDYEEPVKYVSSHKEPNPSSTTQIKKWLHTLGWKPITFETSKSTGKKIPQIRKNIGGEKVLCDSVKELFTKEPNLKLLEGLTVLTHRIGILKGFLRDVDEYGNLTSEISGMTNTLRVKHTKIVNLPSVDKPYGELIRGCLTSQDGKLLVGSDLNSLENMVGLHYAKKYSKEYVDKILVEGYDAHLEMALFAKMLTKEDVKFYKEFDSDYYDHEFEIEDYNRIKIKRSEAKTLNYSATYGVGALTLSKNLKKSKSYAKNLIDSYWDMHKPLKQIAEDAVTTIIDGRLWLYNPMVGFWLELRNEKDKFNTLIQSSGSIITYTWAFLCISRGLNLSLVYHDEVVAPVNYEDDAVNNVLFSAINQVNRVFNLEPEMSVDVQYGKNYANIH